MRTLSRRSVSALVVASFVVGSLALAGTAFAAGPGFGHSGSFQPPAVFGTVASISGDTLTVTAKSWQRNASTTPPTTTYTVDATNATVTKAGATSSVPAIAVGDVVIVQGTVSGTDVTATSIRDGVMMGSGFGMRGMRSQMQHASTTPPIQGNGEPVIGGSVSAISGNALTVTTKAGTSYSVDASSATIVKNGAPSTVSSISTGDNVVVQGTVEGTSVTASSVIDQGAAPQSGAGANPGSHRGVFGAIGGFFSRLFGFF